MNRAERRRQEWLKRHDSDPGTFTWNQEHGIKIDEAKREFLDDIKAGLPIELWHGVFGPETKNSDAYVRVIRPEGGGTYLKVYGCPYKLYIYTDRILLSGLNFAKYSISGFLREVIGQSWLLLGAGILLFLFRRKKFIKIATEHFHQVVHRITWYWEIHELKDKRIKDSDYNEPEKEIERAWLIAVKGTIWEEFGKKFIAFVKLFLHCDNTYKLRVQDALGMGHKDFIHVLNTLISRENFIKGVGYKWKFIKFLVRTLFFLSPSLKKVMRVFLENLDPARVDFTEDDWYFGLSYLSYNFRGWTIEERKAERERLNHEKHIVFLI